MAVSFRVSGDFRVGQGGPPAPKGASRGQSDLGDDIVSQVEESA